MIRDFDCPETDQPCTDRRCTKKLCCEPERAQAATHEGTGRQTRPRLEREKNGRSSAPPSNDKEDVMAVWKEGRTHFFACDVCEHQIAIEEQQNASRDEMRIIPIRLKEDGWLLNKRPGRSWEAQCP